MHNYLRLKES